MLRFAFRRLPTFPFLLLVLYGNSELLSLAAPGYGLNRKPADEFPTQAFTG